MTQTCQTTEKDDQEIVPFRTIQIHPSRKCNLACLHCYSGSGPKEKTMLDIDALKKFLEYAYEQGFNSLSISGGEPFLYDHLKDLFVFSKALGYRNNMVSNGMLLPSARNREILEYVDLIAISIDGKKELHDEIRGQAGAFEKMMKGVAVLQSMQKTFGFIHTITPKSWDSLLWLAAFVYDNGARLLQLHPLEMYGRAIQALGEMQVDDTLAHQAFIMANYLDAKYDGKMAIQLDLLHRDYLESIPQTVDTFSRQCAKKGRLADLIDTIIIDETGLILPIAYGFDSFYAIGNVQHFDKDLFKNYIDDKIPAIKTLFAGTIEKIISNKESDMVNWGEILVAESRKQHQFV